MATINELVLWYASCAVVRKNISTKIMMPKHKRSLKLKAIGDGTEIGRFSILDDKAQNNHDQSYIGCNERWC
jgi:hypothetical protein